MIPQLISLGYYLFQNTFSPWNLAPNNKKSRLRIVFLEDVQDLRCVLAWRIVNGQGDDSVGLGYGHVPEHVWPSVLEMTYEKGWGLVYCVERKEKSQNGAYHDEHGEDAGPARAATEFGG